MNPRTCIVTRKEKTPDKMIRFVVDPMDNVVPDLKRKLPGRGAWVTNSERELEIAIVRKIFDRSFKRKVTVSNQLPEMVDNLLAKEALNLLGLARKAGEAVTGFMKVDALVRAGDIAVLLHAANASDDGKGKLAQSLRVSELLDVPVFNIFEGEMLDEVLGNANSVHVAFTRGGLAKKFESAINRLMDYRGLTRD